MRFVRSRLGLTLWALLWLLVAIITPLRQQAIRSTSSPDYYRFSSEMEQEVARRFPNDATAQLAPLKGVTTWLPNPSATDVYRQQAQYFAQYDALEKRFPSANFVRIQRLRDTLRGPMGIDEGLVPASANYTTGKPNSAWLSKKQLERALQSAREGGRREPDNAFFPWTECVLNFSLKRDDQALLALEKAARCSQFDDDVSGVARRRIALLRRLQNTTFEDEIGEQASVLLPHVSPMRSAARAVTGRMRLARKQGDEKRALEIVGILQRAGGAMTRAKGALITKLVGEAICGIAWKAAIENEPNLHLPEVPWGVIDGPVPQEYFVQREKYELAVNARFVEFARAYGRNDLAKEAEALSASFDGQRLSSGLRSSKTDSIWARYNDFERIRWTGQLLIGLNVLGAVLWIVSFVITLGKPPLSPEQKRKAQLSTLWSAGAGSVLLGVVAMRAPNVLMDGNLFETPPPNPALAFIFDNFLVIFPCIWVLPIVGAMLWNWLKGFKWNLSLKTSDGGRRMFILGVVTAFFLLLLDSALSYNQYGAAQYSLIPPLQTLLALGVLVGSGLWVTWAHDKAAALCFTAAIWLSCATKLLAGSGTYYAFYSVVVGAIAFFCLLMGAILSWRGWLPSWRGTWGFIRELSARTGMVAGALALICTLGFVALALWAIPVERSSKALLDEHLRTGDVAMLRRQISQN